MLERLRARMERERRAQATTVDSGRQWYRAGYIAALDDIDRTGLQPTTDQTKREAADRSLKRWVDEPLSASRRTETTDDEEGRDA